jgi:biopolymer transport protein ExbB
MGGSSHGILDFLRQTDAVGFSVAVLLLGMSVASWAVMLAKLTRAMAIRSSARRVIDGFWEAHSLEAAIGQLRGRDGNPFIMLARAAVGASVHHQRHQAGRLGENVPLAEFVGHALRQGINSANARLEAGLSLLASVGSTAPFVGLFGTVWGIYHALIGISTSGQATIDKVAGPVGEALIMTALGLAVAIPAVLGYNALVRAHRLIHADLDAFAHDLHVYLASGVRLESAAAPTAATRGRT